MEDLNYKTSHKIERSRMLDSIFGKPFRFLMKKRVEHDVLDRHTAIAWDLDYTIINGPLSWFWRRWIRDNHERCKFIIVTFRTAETENDRNCLKEQIFKEIENCKDPLKREWFEAVCLINPKLWANWNGVPVILQDVLSRDDMSLYMKRTCELRGLDINRIIDINRSVRAWKAAECKKLGYTLLVEDRETFCKPSCKIFGIEFLSALNG